MCQLSISKWQLVARTVSHSQDLILPASFACNNIKIARSWFGRLIATGNLSSEGEEQRSNRSITLRGRCATLPFVRQRLCCCNAGCCEGPEVKGQVAVGGSWTRTVSQELNASDGQ